ncbi:MAG: guanylate kinase [Acidobacteriota bacterium]|nr:guanylate kinase [Acidobacteriota bacterium]
MIFIISGPSGCGKSTLVRNVLEEIDNIEFSVSFTTRKMRDEEEEGKDYYFVSKEKFEQMIEEKMLAEWAVVHGHYYGTSRREIEKKGAGKDLLLDIDVQGAQKIREKFRKAVFIFILPPVFQELKRRLQKRGQERPEAVKERLEMAKREIRHYPHFDYIIINDKLDDAVHELKSIIVGMKCRTDLCQKEILPILRSFSEGEI